MENNNTPCEGCRPGESTGRRRFLSQLSIGLSVLGGLVVSIPVLGAFLQPLLKKSMPSWRALGSVSDYEVGKTLLVRFDDGEVLSWARSISHSAAWLRRLDENSFEAFAINCAHLGCPVRWEESSSLFLCPCHGGVYYKNGEVAAGPPLRGLSRYSVRVRKGKVEILTRGIPITTLTS